MEAVFVAGLVDLTGCTGTKPSIGFGQNLHGRFRRHFHQQVRSLLPTGGYSSRMSQR